MSALAKYIKLFDIGFQNTFVYRWNFVLRSLFGIVPLIGTIYLWRAIFDSGGGQLGTYDYSKMLMYFAFVVLVENLITPTEDEWQIAADIKDGRISSTILKPLNYLAYRFTLYVSYRMLYTLVILPGIALIFFFLREHIVLPSDLLTWLAFGVSVVMAGLIQFFLAFALAMLAFWIYEITTVVFIVFSFEYFLSGQIIPLDLMPSWMAGFVKWAPFTYELFFPVQIIMGRVQGIALTEGLLIQTAWTLLAYLGATAMWRAGIRRYQAFGG